MMYMPAMQEEKHVSDKGVCTSDSKDLLSACGEGQGDSQRGEDDEAGFQRVPAAAEGCILSGQEHVQSVPAGHLPTHSCTSEWCTADMDHCRLGFVCIYSGPPSWDRQLYNTACLVDLQTMNKGSVTDSGASQNPQKFCFKLALTMSNRAPIISPIVTCGAEGEAG